MCCPLGISRRRVCLQRSIRLTSDSSFRESQHQHTLCSVYRGVANLDFAKMPAQGTQQLSCHRIHLYLSHSWLYAEHGTTLSLWIFEERWQKNSVLLKFFNYSLPSDDPIHYESSIARCHVVVIPTGMYADHRQWIQLEIDGAIHYSKPILGVNPWGQQRSHSVVSNEAAMMVYWTPESVLDGIWELFD